MRKRDRRRGLTLQIFTWALAAAMLGESNPFPETFNKVMPVFSEMGQVIAEVAEIGETRTPTPTAIPTPTPTPVDCPLALPSRISIGDQVKVLAELHFRSSPKMASNNLISSHHKGDILRIIGGPVCTPHGMGAYLWWQVETLEGDTGWSAEGAANTKNYFMDPMGE